MPLKFCQTCGIYRPPGGCNTARHRTVHCPRCNRCVSELDHHCIWLNNCIGHRNYGIFILMMHGLLANAIVATLNLPWQEFIHLDYIESKHSIFTSIVLFAVLPANLIVGILLLLFTIFHWRLMLSGTTSYEFVKGKLDDYLVDPRNVYESYCFFKSIRLAYSRISIRVLFEKRH